MKWNFIFAGYLKEFSLLAAATHVRCEFVNMCINISICLHSLFCCRSSMANFPCGASSRLEVRGSRFSPRTRHALGSSIIGGNQLPHPKRRRMLRFIFIKNRALQRLPLLRMWVWVCVCVYPSHRMLLLFLSTVIVPAVIS